MVVSIFKASFLMPNCADTHFTVCIFIAPTQTFNACFTPGIIFLFQNVLKIAQA